MSKYQEDEQLLLKIRQGEQKVVRQVYEVHREAFASFLQKQYNVGRQNALEVYPLSFSIFYFNIKNQKLKPPLQSTLRTYLFSIGKNVFRKEMKKLKPLSVKDEGFDEAVNADIEQWYENKERARLVRRLLGRIDEPCRKLLSLIYIQEYAFDAVAREMNLNNTGTVRKRKFDCLKKLRKLLQSDTPDENA